MRYALLVVNVPGVDTSISRPEIADDGRRFSRVAAGTLASATEISTLSENVWLIPLASDQLTLARLTALAVDNHLTFHTLWFDERPEVLTYPPTQET